MSKKEELIVFLVDDDIMFLDTLKHFLSDEKNKELKISVFKSGEECIENLYLKPDIVVLDYYLDGSIKAMDGITTLKKIKTTSPQTYVIMLSGQDNIDIALETINFGAFEYVVKSESAFIRIRNIINNITKTIRLKDNYKKYDFYYKLISIIIVLLLLGIFIINRIISLKQ